MSERLARWEDVLSAPDDGQIYEVIAGGWRAFHDYRRLKDAPRECWCPID